MNTKQITKEISYIEASADPLSADIGIVRTHSGIWLYDVGNDKNSIRSLTGRYNVVLSHFHIDHIGSLNELDVENLYVSQFTYKYTGRGSIVRDDMYIDNLHIFPLPSSHVKGALGLEVDGEYAFVGDAISSKRNAEYFIYNAQLLRDEIEVLKKLKAEYLLLSHRKGLLRRKDEIVQELEAIYSCRDKNSHEIFVKMA